MTICAPGYDSDNICYTLSQLKEIAKEYNKKHKDKIKIGTKKEIWKQLEEKLKTKCGKKQNCWRNQGFISNKLKENTENVFKPKMPEHWKNNLSEWLSTIDINKVLKQYNNKYDEFLFMGAVPIDCPTEIRCQLTKLKLDKLLQRKIEVIGIVYNLDKHDRPGSHWVACIIDIPKNVIGYYDSNGIEPPKILHSFFIKIRNQLRSIHNKDTEILSNGIRHQRHNGQCGIFSINFVLEYIKKRDFYKVVKMKFNDKQMEKLRKEYYI